MKIISVVNLKGGVGKTITAVNMAYILATDYKKRVLLIDADHQGNSSRFYKADVDGLTIADILEGGESLCGFITQPTIYRNLDIIPADMRLLAADIDSVKNGKTAVDAITGLCADFAEDDRYDFIIIDCPPAFSSASISAIAASTDIVIPIKIDAFSIAGTNELEAQIHGVRRLNSNVHIAGCLITMFDRSDVAKQGEAWLRENSNLHIFDTHIRNTPKVVESTYPGTPIVEWSERCGASRDYRAFVEEFLFGGELAILMLPFLWSAGEAILRGKVKEEI